MANNSNKVFKVLFQWIGPCYKLGRFKVGLQHFSVKVPQNKSEKWRTVAIAMATYKKGYELTLLAEFYEVKSILSVLH